MKRIIPGHVRAVTWLLALVLAVVVYRETGRPDAVGGAVLLTLGFFLADQATHLAQEEHAEVPPTWLERMQQKYRWTFVILGVFLVSAGAIILVKQ
jgi:hypothetical protein